MIISDLNHVEVVSQETETSIVGGYSYYPSYFFSAAEADAGAVAIGGPLTLTKVKTFTATAPGLSASAASSASLTAGY